jgi:adhesin/invasin
VIDFNLDHVPDVVVEAPTSTGDQLYSFAGNGNGTFTQVASLSTPPIGQLVSGDFDHDGFPDLAGPGTNDPARMTYFFGNGHGNFSLQQVVGPEGQYAAVGDFNGDGIPDVVVPDQASFVSLVLGQKNRNFSVPLALTPATVTSVATGDINGDGLPEIFVGGFLESSTPGPVFLNQGNNSFSLGTYTDPSAFTIADLTGHKVVDLLGGVGSSLEIWPNNGSLDFSASPITLSQPTSNVAVADMDGDGHPDILSACEDTQCPGQIFYGGGSYQFAPVTITNFESPFILGDFNGDGKKDIATGSGTFLNTGNRTFQEVTQNNLPLETGALVAVGDFNGDGKDDVAVNSTNETTVSIWYSNGDGTFYLGSVVDAGQYPGALAIGDFDGDGRLDLAVGLLYSQQVCLLFNAGNGQFTRSFFASGAMTNSMVSADLNRDGKPDLVIGNFVFSFAPANVNVVFHK